LEGEAKTRMGQRTLQYAEILIEFQERTRNSQERKKN
jgi:hypothetical protein